MHTLIFLKTTNMCILKGRNLQDVNCISVGLESMGPLNSTWPGVAPTNLTTCLHTIQVGEPHRGNQDVNAKHQQNANNLPPPCAGVGVGGEARAALAVSVPQGGAFPSSPTPTRSGAVSATKADVAPEGSGDGPGHCTSLGGSGEAVAQRNCVLIWFQGEKKGRWVCVGSAEFCHLTLCHS